MTGRVCALAVPLLVLGACSAPPAQTAPSAGHCDLTNFLAVQHAHVNRAEVTLCGTVERVRAVRVTRSGAHRVFRVDVGHGDSIEIDSNVDVMGDFPIRPGDPVTVRGEYYYDPNGREGVHFTHHANGGRHAAGYVVIEGRTFS